MPLPRALAAVALAALAALLAACGSSSAPEPNIEKPLYGWRIVPGMRCADGSPTGIGISPGRSDAVLVYLAFGGACWGTGLCSSNIPRAFGSLEYTFVQLAASGTIFDPTLAGNPYATWTKVFVPYCTGDVHAGDAVTAHGGETWQHHGWRNLQLAVDSLTAELPRPAQVVVAGSSAGGYGALAAHDLVRSVWDPAGGTSAALLDDSAPTFVGTATPPALLSAWWDAWGLGSTIGTRCGSRCRPTALGGDGDLSALWEVVHANNPQDRLALLSTTQDGTMRGFFADATLSPPVPEQTPQEFEANLAALAAKLSGIPNTASYRVGGVTFSVDHALLVRAPFLQSPQGPPLLGWLGAMVAPDPAWTSSTSP